MIKSGVQTLVNCSSIGFCEVNLDAKKINLFWMITSFVFFVDSQFIYL